MAAGIAIRKAPVLFLGLAIAAVFQTQARAAGVNESHVPAYVAPSGTGDLIMRVLRADGDALKGPAKIHLATGQGLTAEGVTDSKQRHEAQFRGIPLGFVRLRIEADGCATADLKLLLEHPERETRVTVYLRTEAQGQPGVEGWLPALSANASEHVLKSVDFLGRGDLEKSRRQFRKLHRADVGDSNLQDLAAVLDYRKGNIGMALFHFSQAAYLNPENEDLARALAELLYRTGIYSAAYEELSRLEQKHPQDWELGWEAASAAFLSDQYYIARQSAQAAYDRGGAAALPAEYLVAFADALQGKWPEARVAATTVATQSSDAALRSAAKDLLGAEGGDTTGGSDRGALARERAEPGLFSAGYFEPRVPPRLWAPPDVDASMPRTIQSPPCNTAEVLNLAGQRVVTRFEQLGEVTARVQIEQALLGVTGRVTPFGHFTADYLPDVIVESNGSYTVAEFFAAVIPDPSPESGVDQGHAGLAKIFAPSVQPDFSYECEGLTLWKDRRAWSISFTQRKDRPTHLNAYSYTGRVLPAYIRGRGFVDQSSGELLHVETDLRNPIPELQLEEEHLVVEYKAVKFKSATEPYYLPSQAELYLNVGGGLYRVREDFTEYVRFAVDTRQEIKKPSGQEEK